MSDIVSLTLTEVRDKLAAGDIKAEEAVAACLDRIAATEPRIKAILHLQADKALETAKAMDAAGPDPAKRLWGVPILVKDAICVADAPTTCASKILENFVPFYDAECIRKLKDAGAVILGKANLDEFAMGSSTENSAYQITANPWDLSRVPGGSSGGSAAAVAAGQCFAALGTDTGGSIRQPAAFCGTVGIKPTYGRVSRYGLVAYGSSLDQIGPLTRTAADAAAMLTVIAGHDAKDSTSAPREVPDFEKAIAGAADLSGLTIGLPDEYWGEGVDAEVREACRQAMDTAASLGAKVVSVSLPHTPYAVATYYIVAMAEASSNLARFDGVRYGRRAPQAKTLEELYELSRSEGFGAEVRRRIVIGTYVLSAGYYDAYYRKAAQVRRLIRQDFLDAYSKCDVVCGPTSPFAAFPIGKMSGDPLQMYLSDIFTISLNLAGLPGLSMPVGLGKDSGLPIGMQLFGPAFDETAILRTAKVLGNALPKLPQPAAVA
ncbi:MAG: Asp-tRNA(Asn)/Glu-tRNA(Gln) amidotransferase subunit GatA [Solidesulfovibrio sp.]|uniref:Asp-tRNA(Asn)/Glu-tRNA(Gln) amidotransferase subunit GatA n=1 Tax=Solidesulfovibrio sp. TaxID=2910990 RepID=UPI002B201B75|nr:Asp-tRNA(Asn)/Glu-tRNA(Gln) amidotransferase subunit GatA [Solidesulfovibrio sp.]MEA4857985.1 Asp-tRNA(Asn)/Glu-tRNA(Gln) amidotransferase subunit GatA [Solidesulfovibrio sp.]